ncbi:MAG: glycoside hydrolase family 127 protein, partial [Verrucomicrobia bacterium]|nr:glycoside hydrolase family 127 protein [Verrucomicrobiota bacterium]
IETCCTVAWIALTVDYLKLTGDPRAVDDLELATLNGGLGAQHVSGRWWTYNTPMDGVREASAHTIVFQARAGTPELNCCSVNGPRVLGMLSEWAVMSTPQGLAVNSFLPGAFTVSKAGKEIRLVLDRDYPMGDSQRMRIASSGEAEWTLQLRIPAWSANTRVQANFEGAPAHASAGSYLEIRRRWKAGDEVDLHFDFGLRAVAGANEAGGKVSLYRGPLLLAWDQAQTTFDEANLPAINLARLSEARVVAPAAQTHALQPKTWLQVEVPAENGSALRLVDFPSAGSAGTRYRSWLPATKLPPPAFTQYPRDAERVRPGPVQFQWRGVRHVPDLNYRVEIAGDAAFAGISFATNRVAGPRLVLDLAALPATRGPDRWWRVITVSTNGETIPDVPPARFTLAADAPARVLPPVSKPGPEGELVLHSLRHDERPRFGEPLSSKSGARGADGTQVKGRDQMLVYAVPAWPEEDFTVSVRVRLDEMPKGRLGQIFSAWAAAMDDPLRLVVEQGKLFARIEAGGVFGTPGVPIDAGRWHHVCAVKRGETLALFLDGQPAGSCAAPRFATTTARDCSLGGNPHFSGDESLTATFADFGLWERALSAEELRRLAVAEHN